MQYVNLGKTGLEGLANLSGLHDLWGAGYEGKLIAGASSRGR